MSNTRRILVASLIVPFISFYSAFSQDHRINVETTYNVPLAKLSWTYKPGPGIRVGYASVKTRKSGFSRAIGLAVGYSVLQPLADTLYYVVDEGGASTKDGGGAGFGYAVCSPFQMFHLDGNFEWGIPLGKHLSLKGGFSLGLLYGKREMDFTTDFGGSDGMAEFVTWAAFRPRIGLDIPLNKHLSTSLFTTYTLIAQVGSTEQGAMDYNENTGMLAHFYSPGVSINFLF